VVLSEPVLKSVHQSLVKYRTIIKMLLGSMQENARTTPLTALDQIAIIQLKDVMEEVQKSYDNYDFQRAVSAINRWVANDLSAFYLEGLKDRLYCADGGGVLEPIFFGFLRMLAPITPVLVEEAWDHAPAWLTEDEDVLHPLRQLYSAPLIDPARLTQDERLLKEAIPVLLTAHSAVKSALEEARTAKYVGSSLQSSVVFRVPDGSMTLKMLEPVTSELEAIFVVSQVDVEIGDGTYDPSEGQEWSCQASFGVGDETIKVWVLPPEEHKCPRCWRYVSPQEDQLCKRCEDVVAAL
jgi:isoleucyl-tRNA synthetase